jgi:2-iminobutanoate/2-iminopropanoate deaminase
MKKVISTPEAPAAIGPYSQAVGAGAITFFSGQIPLDPRTGELVAGGVAEQTRQVLLNLGAVLKATGLGFEQVVKTTVFLTNLQAFGEMNGVYETFFATNPPARSTVQVVALPKGAQVEIEAVAVNV